MLKPKGFRLSLIPLQLANMAKISVFEQKFDPLYQAALVLGITFLLNVIGLVVRSTDTVGVGNRFPWLAATAMMLFFAMLNVVFSVSSKKLIRYWSRSIYAFIALALGAGLLAWAFSGLTISQAGSYKWIYLVVTISYIVFSVMISLLRKIVDFAQKEEWNSPKIRQKKKK